MTCGIVEIDGPSEVDPGVQILFKVKVLQISKPEIKWSVSAGTIVGGQGTELISVNSAWLAGQTVTATVELIGAPSGCNSSASTTTRVAPPPLPQRAYDSYGEIDFEYEKARLDSLAIQVLNRQGSGLIQISAGQITFKGEAAYRLDRAKSYLVVLERSIQTASSRRIVVSLRI